MRVSITLPIYKIDGEEVSMKSSHSLIVADDGRHSKCVHLVINGKQYTVSARDLINAIHKATVE